MVSCSGRLAIELRVGEGEVLCPRKESRVARDRCVAFQKEMKCGKGYEPGRAAKEERAKFDEREARLRALAEKLRPVREAQQRRRAELHPRTEPPKKPGRRRKLPLTWKQRRQEQRAALARKRKLAFWERP